ncbi:MAG: ABC transporter ATP-binding protein, partial [Acidimicrobiales bacterium]|nr:ABC transporter ATP-binding protein [Acidimicrobiales bacterium]
MTTTAAIEIEDLSKRFGTVDAVCELSFTVAPGRVTGFLGPNGAGKSTTVRVLAGLDDTFGGRVEVCGVEVRADPREVKRRVGYVPENAALFDGLTAIEFLELVGRLRHLGERLVARRAADLLHAFGLEERAHGRLGGFSKGMRQKVLLASALIHDPEVLFLDEPLSGLDVSSTILVKELIRALADRGTTVFYCSHMMDVVERVCDRIVVIDEGRIAADGTFDELQRMTDAPSLEGVLRRLTGGDGPDERVREVLDA